MGVDIQTYRGRIGCFKGSIGCDVVTIPCNVNFSSGMKTIGAVVFIGLLLIIGGVEANPGPTRQDASRLNKEGEVAMSTVTSLTAVDALSPGRVPTANWRNKEDSDQSIKEGVYATSKALVVVDAPSPDRPSTADRRSREDTAHSIKEDDDAASTVTPLPDLDTPLSLERAPVADRPIEAERTEQRSPKRTIQNIAEHPYLIWIFVAVLWNVLNFHLFVGFCLLCVVLFVLLKMNDSSKKDDSMKDTSHSKKDDKNAKSAVHSLTAVVALSPWRTPTAEWPTKEDTPHSNKEGDDAVSTVTTSTVIPAVTQERAPTTDGLIKGDERATQLLSHADSTVNQGSLVRTEEDDSDTRGPSGENFLNILLQRLELSDKYPEKISSSEIVCVDINSQHEDHPYSLKDVPYKLLKQIILVNCEARDRVQNGLESVDSEQNDECPDDTDNFFNDVELFERNSSFISPLDIFHIVLACCDPMLKQNLYRKLYLCKIALPFITKFNTLQAPRLEIWPLRTLYVFNSDTKRGESVIKVHSHFLGFARLGRPSFSKSRLLNCLLSGESNAFQTFYNNECPSGMIEHTATQGVVESFWLQTNVNTSVSSKTVAFLNMRGELNDHFDDKSRMFIQKTCQCLILIPDLNGIETRLEKITSYLLKFKHLIFVFPGQTSERTRDLFNQIKIKASKTGTEIFAVNTKGGANFFDIVCSLAKRLKSILANQNADSLENKLKVVPHITTDEDEELNKKGKTLADEVLKVIHSDVEGTKIFKPYKLLITPVSAVESKKISDCIKKIEREQSKEKQNELFNMKHTIQTNQIKRITPSLKCFLCKLKEATGHQLLKRFFLGWIHVQLGEETSHIIERHKEIKSKEQAKYLEMKKELPEDSQELKDQKQKMVQAIEELENSMFGVDHLFREISHIYNTIFELDISTLQTGLLSKDDVTTIFADFIIEGESFEVIDGDSMFMAKYWMKAITQAADIKMKNARVASLSVLGLQSSGKSTMLNTMFGVHFSVSTGRCTKGINAQLLPVRNNGTEKVPFKYVMVVDSEGLRAPELDDIATKADRDNALASFVTGLGDLTLMNIMGENFADMKDILQIIVHALLRLKLANNALKTGQACVFVHHNVTDKSARENMKDGFLKLVQTLDSVTVEAAKAEGISDITRFSEVIKFDVDENVFHVPNLWQGIVPMNRVNTGYSDGVLSIKSSLMKIISGVGGKSFNKLSDFTANAEDLWKGILVENFVFSFRNSLEIKAYCSLEEQIQKVIWENEINEKEIIFNNIQKKFASCTNRTSLKAEKNNLDAGFKNSIVQMKQQVLNKVEMLFEKNEYPDIVIKWKGAALININHRSEQLENSMRSEIDNAYQRCVIGIETASVSREKTEKLRQESMIIAKRLQGRELDDNTIKKHFDEMWNSSMGHLQEEHQVMTQEINQMVSLNLYEIHKNDYTLITNELNRVNFAPSNTLSFDRSGITQDDISIKKYFGIWKKGSKTETMPLVKKEIDVFLSEGDSMIKRLMQTSKEISNMEVKKFIHSIWNSLTTLSTKHETEHFTLKKTALIKAHVHVCLYACPLFKKHNETFDREHGTTAQLEKCKKDMFISFMDCINNRRAEETSAKFFCTGVGRSFKKITQRKVCIKVVQELQGKLPYMKHVLIKEICIELANRNNFDEFINYLTNPEVFASTWYKTKGDELLFSNKRYSSMVEDMISRMTDELERAVRSLNARLKSPITGSSIFKTVSEQLENKLEVMEFVSFRSDEREIKDIGYFTEILMGETGKLKIEIDSVSFYFKSITAQNVTWEMNPYDNLLESIWGCKEACPFCKEPCAKSSTSHAMSDHYCFQHRIPCCTGVRHSKTKEAYIVVCNNDVQTRNSFGCSFTKCKCGRDDHFLPFAECRKYFPGWDIPPSTNAQDCSQFWLWFVNNHKQRLSEHYGYNTGNIPSSWSNITKAIAIKSLDRYSAS